MIDTKYCRQCKTTKPIMEFYRLRKDKPELRPHCKICNRKYFKIWRIKNKDKDAARGRQRRKLLPERYKDYDRKKVHGVAFGTYDKMLKEQSGLCAICKSDTPQSKRRSFSIDHCHKTGKIRALLCDPCNHGIGNFKDNADLLLAAIEYLKIHRA